MPTPKKTIYKTVAKLDQPSARDVIEHSGHDLNYVRSVQALEQLLQRGELMMKPDGTIRHV